MRRYVLSEGHPYTTGDSFPCLVETQSMNPSDLRRIINYMTADGCNIPIRVVLGYGQRNLLGEIPSRLFNIETDDAPPRYDFIRGEYVQRTLFSIEWEEAQYEEAQIFHGLKMVAAIMFRRIAEEPAPICYGSDHDLIVEIHAMLKKLTQSHLNP